jgi:hypothetical protein
LASVAESIGCQGLRALCRPTPRTALRSGLRAADLIAGAAPTIIID